MSALNGMEIEVRMNPYAFFTTGYKTDATSTLAPRTWKIKNI